MSHFRTDLVDHKKKIGKIMSSAVSELTVRAVNHDLDKIENDIIFEIYEEYSERWRNAPFRSAEHFKIKEEMKEAHDLHALQDHHFYSDKNPLEKDVINLFDHLENIVDWIAASTRDCETREQLIDKLTMMLQLYYLERNEDERLVEVLIATATYLINLNFDY